MQRLGPVMGKLTAKGSEGEDLSKGLREVNEQEEASALERTTSQCAARLPWIPPARGLSVMAMCVFEHCV